MPPSQTAGHAAARNGHVFSAAKRICSVFFNEILPPPPESGSNVGVVENGGQGIVAAMSPAVSLPAQPFHKKARRSSFSHAYNRAA